jgi:hypothetical protein
MDSANFSTLSENAQHNNLIIARDATTARNVRRTFDLAKCAGKLRVKKEIVSGQSTKQQLLTLRLCLRRSSFPRP